MTRDHDEQLAVARAQVGVVLRSPSWCQVVPALPQVDLPNLFEEVGRASRQVRGTKMRTGQGLYDEFAAACQFAPYFGENANAFVDCMRDLPFSLPGANGFVVVVDNEHHVRVAHL